MHDSGIGDNLHTPPETEVEAAEVTGAGCLASRSDRLVASIVDAIIYLPIMALVLYFTGIWEIVGSREFSNVEMFFIRLAPFLGYLTLNGYLLMHFGQTIGKRMVNIQIISFKTKQLMSLRKLFFIRYLPWVIIGRIPLIGLIIQLVDVLFIFRKDRRCLHDLLAGSEVIVAIPRRRRR